MSTNNRILVGALLPIALTLASASSAHAGESIWIEGESSSSHTFNKHSWYTSTDVRKDLLSPGVPAGAKGDWLGHFDGGGKAAKASYSFTVTEGGAGYTLWLRCNPFKAAHTWQLNSAAAKAIDFDDPRERLNLISPKIDMRYLAWIKVASGLTLTKGSQTLTINVSKHASSSSAHGGIDVLVLTNTAWAPSGASKPKPAGGPAPQADDWFPLHVDDDAFSAQSVTDMSGLLHKPAGKHGAITRKDKGLVLAKTGASIKLWGVNAGMAATAALQQQQARFYAKHGVNLVRQHPVEGAVGLLTKGAFDAAKLDAFDTWFSLLKAEGIYMAFSPFYPHVITAADGYAAALYAELPSRGAGKSTSGMVNFMPALQDAQWQWLKALLEHKNPHTGLRYVDDPALAIVETHNEDSLFWHAPLNDLATGTKYPKHTAELKKLWMQWVKKTYSDDKALAAAWGKGLRSGDSVQNAAMKIYGAWEMASAGPQNKDEQARMGDFIRFLAETQRAFYQQREDRLRKLGFKGLTVTTAWKAGGPAAGAANLWCDDAADVIDRHNYFGGGVGGHNIEEGKLQHQSHLSLPGRGLLSIGLYQVEDKPFVLSEWTQKPPNQYKAEAAPLVALYGMGLQGWDGFMHFAASRVRMGSGWPGLRSYISETPHYFGQFPALAYAVHKGHLKEGALVFARRLSLKQAFSGIDTLKQDFTAGYDDKEPKYNPETPVEVLAIGRVTAKVKDGQQSPLKADWSKHWDKTSKQVSSETGELVWDYADKVVLIKSKKTQGVLGFAGGKTWDLPGVKATIKTSFVSLLLTPLDDQELTKSSKILITAMARDRQTGAAYSSDGAQLLKVGGPPLLLEPVEATLTFSGAAITSARAVDIYGVPTSVEVQRTGNAVTLDGSHATYYYLVTTSAPPPPDGGTGGDGAGGADGAAAGDASSGGARGEDGCGCRATGGPDPGSAGLALLLLTLLLVIVRTKRHSAR